MRTLHINLDISLYQVPRRVGKILLVNIFESIQPHEVGIINSSITQIRKIRISKDF